MITYKFCITKFNLTVKTQNVDWVVRDIEWIYSGVNESGIYASVAGSTTLDFSPDQSEFIPISDITQDNLTTWLLDKMGGPFLRHLRDSIQGTIERNSQIISGEIPMDTWLPLSSPGITPVSNEVLDAYLSR